MMSELTTLPCPRCGQAVSAGWLGGLCPRCLSRTSLRALLGGVEGAAARPRLGDYELGEELGRGAMGAVYRARHVTLGQVVALKVVLAGEFAGEAERRRFLAEAGQAARLDHPNLVRVLNYGEAEGRQFYAMELVEGPTLAEALRTGGPGRLTLPERASLLAQVARALQHAHERGVLHRDLKPGNILLDTQGRPRVTDFGLAKTLGPEAGTTGRPESVTGSPVGTPAYMAPEQVRGDRTVTIAADIWSLGAVLYELLAGRPPFVADSAVETYRQILEEEPRRVTSEDSSSPVPRDLEVIALKCLRKDPAKRYASAGALADDLDRWLRGEPIQARPVGAPERLWRWTRRRPLVAALSALLVLGTVAGAFILARANRDLSRALGATRFAEAQARTNLHRALLAQIRTRRGVNEIVSPVETLQLLAEIARTSPTADTRNEAVLALAVRDVERAAPSDPPPSDGLVFRQFAPPARPIRQACMIDTSPDGRLVLVGSFDGLHLWDFATGRELWSLDQAGLPWMTAAFSPDGKSLLCSARNFGIQRRPIEVSTGPESGRLAVRVGAPESIGRKFDSTIQSVHRGDRDWLVALDRNPLYIVRVELWPDGDPGRAKQVAAGEPMTWVTISPDQRWVASTTFPPKDARLWDATTGRSLGMLGATDAISAGFTPDSRHLLTRTQTGYTVWDVTTRQQVHHWSTPQSGMAGRIRFSGDGRWLALLQGNDRIVVHRATDWQEAVTLTLPKVADLYDCVWSRDDRHLILTGMDGHITVWDFTLLRRELSALGLGLEERALVPPAR